MMSTLHKAVLLVLVITCFTVISAEAGEREKITMASMSWDVDGVESTVLTSQVLDGIVGKAFSNGGVDVHIVRMPWARALDTTAEGIYEGVAPVYYSRDREEAFMYSMPFWRVNEVFVTPEGSEFSYNGTVESLHNSTIGVVRGALPALELEGMGVNVEAVSTFTQNIMMLAHGRFDAVLMPEDIFHALNQDLVEYIGGTRLQVSGEFKSYDLCIAISKKVPSAPGLIAKFNDGLKQIIMDGTFDAVIAQGGFLMDLSGQMEKRGIN